MDFEFMMNPNNSINLPGSMQDFSLFLQNPDSEV